MSQPEFPPPTARLAGIDFARGLAVFGMFAAHVGPDPAVEAGITGAVMQFTHGRSSALFAMLAGVSLALTTGRQQPEVGVQGRQAVVRIVIRAVVLVALGMALTMLDTPVDVIIAYYGVYFLLALPLIRLRARTLAAVAAGLAVVGPLASFWVRSVVDFGAPDGIVGLLLTGTYPAITWMPFVIAGMALGRLDLGSPTVLRRLALLGPALGLLGYGGSWLALEVFGGREALLAGSPDALQQLNSESGAVTTESPAALLVAFPHSGTPFEIVGALGVAITVVPLAIAAVSRIRWLLLPVIAVGTMSLTAYVGHVLAIGALGVKELPGPSLTVLIGFIVVTTVAAALWKRLVGRGPLEYLVALATRPALLVR
ncbi:heparan-alpha-glucosaminide N-acetyltransferase domain-containing protein [Kutzneria buriramensis]|uniref:Uncharacterized protein DUF418 n=1 Tax=Kutzneria buriramensis TaxID=1045776 RepID=A0A3E0GX20_9PSEU|nr:heparan-alpha-glucosaminide N-acetyltransferase domain-containing protein [Kutzneria buriramensis]REH29652.1 uncharacterized protein DUF418 [Kutzneria buriramensis]